MQPGHKNAPIVRLAPFVLYANLHIRMDALHYRAIVADVLEIALVSFTYCAGGFQVEDNVDRSDPSRLAEHVFRYFQPAAFKLDIHIRCPNAHGSDHAGCQSHAYRISGTKSFSLTAVIGWRIRFYFTAALHVGAFTSQVAGVFNFSCHLQNIYKGLAIVEKDKLKP